jgi:aspartate carbamoyltransferase catalytic subunit
MSALQMKHLIGLRGAEAGDIRKILDTAVSFREVLDRNVKKVPSLRGVTIVNLFFENSTRTRLSFELAEKRLSADSINFTTASSSVKKGESLIDTVRNIEAMKIDMAVVRATGTGIPEFLVRNTNATIVNAGDGANEHPTQALLDMFTMEQALGSLKGKKVLIAGDILHSRVARSNAWGLQAMGAEVTWCAPPTLVPRHWQQFGVRYEPNLRKAIEGQDVIMALRLQKERQQDALLPSLQEYREFYGIRSEVLENLSSDVLLMHPGPINRGVEMDANVADAQNSVILEQVTSGVAVRMAVLFLLAGGE